MAVKESTSNINQEMSSAIVNPSQFIAMLESATAEERAQIAQVFGDMMPKKAPKEKKPAAVIPETPVTAAPLVATPSVAAPAVEKPKVARPILKKPAAPVAK